MVGVYDTSNSCYAATTGTVHLEQGKGPHFLLVASSQFTFLLFTKTMTYVASNTLFNKFMRAL